MKRSALLLTALVLMNLAPFSRPRSASAADVTLYELTENMQWLLRPQGTTYRVATSALTGWAALGSPLCPATLVATYNPSASACAVNATGSDRIDVRTGQGDFSGTCIPHGGIYASEGAARDAGLGIGCRWIGCHGIGD